MLSPYSFSSEFADVNGTSDRETWDWDTRYTGGVTSRLASIVSCTAVDIVFSKI